LPTKLWCDQVTLTPLPNKIKVFKRGPPKGLNTIMPKGGQTEPKSWVGQKATWKKVQKKAPKKQTSLVINKIIPTFKPSVVEKEYSPE